LDFDAEVTMTSCRTALVTLTVALFVAFPLRLDAQEDVLPSADPNLRALRSQRSALVSFSPFDNRRLHLTSPDAQALGILDDAESSASSELRAVIDLLAVYENVQCEPDRAMLKPILKDRLRLYSDLLGSEAERAASPLGPPSIVTLPATSKKALKLHDDLVAAKNRLDAIAASLK